jgi:hypothetical protein
LKAFNSVADEIADVLLFISTFYVTDLYVQLHPYARAALSTLTCASVAGFFFISTPSHIDENPLVTDDSQSGKHRWRRFASAFKCLDSLCFNDGKGFISQDYIQARDMHSDSATHAEMCGVHRPLFEEENFL